MVSVFPFRSHRTSRSRLTSAVRCFLAALACSVVLLACESDVDVFVPRDALPFSLEASFEVNDRRHFVRVQPLQDGIPLGTDSTIDAEVTLQDVTTGEAYPMRDSLFSFDGVLVHNFYVDLKLELGRRYRIVARRSDGATTTATARTPDPYPPPSVTQPNKQCLAQIRVGIEGAPRLLRADVRYRVDGGTRSVTKINRTRRIGEETRFRFRPECDLIPIVGTVDTTDSDSLKIYRCTRLDTGRIPVVLGIVGDDWPTNVGFAPEEDVDRAINVDGGLGFFGISLLDTVFTHVDTAAKPDTLINGEFPMKNDLPCPTPL